MHSFKCSNQNLQTAQVPKRFFLPRRQHQPAHIAAAVSHQGKTSL